MLAGISADYYLRLERGKDRNPSPQVLAALARVLLLDEAHRAHLDALAADVPPARAEQVAEEPPSGVLQLLGSVGLPAYVEGRRFDILASNRHARALSPQLIVGRNLLRDLVLDPAVQALHGHWEASAECLVANLRQSLGRDPGGRDLVALAEELSARSDEFARLWARHEVRGQSGGEIRFDHPLVGDLVLQRERLGIDGAEGQSLVVFHAEAGTPAVEKLARVLSGVGRETESRAAHG